MIHAPVTADFGLAIGFGRNAGTDAGPMKAGADGVLALVGEKIGGPLLGQAGGGRRIAQPTLKRRAPR